MSSNDNNKFIKFVNLQINSSPKLLHKQVWETNFLGIPSEMSDSAVDSRKDILEELSSLPVTYSLAYVWISH